MAVVVYRRGNTHTVNGIRCELKIINHELFNGEPDPGWFFSPEDAYKEIDNGLQKEENEAKEEEKEMSNEEIRTAAKDAGIENFDKARIGTLKEKLKNAE